MKKSKKSDCILSSNVCESFVVKNMNNYKQKLHNFIESSNFISPDVKILLEGYIGPSGSKLLCLWQTQKLWSTCVATFHTCLSVGPIRLYPRAPWIIKLYHLLINTKRFVVVVGDEKSVSKIEIWIIFLEELFNHPASLPLLLLFRQRRLR